MSQPSWYRPKQPEITMPNDQYGQQGFGHFANTLRGERPQQQQQGSPKQPIKGRSSVFMDAATGEAIAYTPKQAREYQLSQAKTVDVQKATSLTKYGQSSVDYTPYDFRPITSHVRDN